MPRRLNQVEQAFTFSGFFDFLFASEEGGQPLFDSAADLARSMLGDGAEPTAIKSKATQLAQIFKGNRPIPATLRAGLERAVPDRIAERLPGDEVAERMAFFARSLVSFQAAHAHRHEQLRATRANFAPRTAPTSTTFVTVPYLEHALQFPMSRSHFLSLASQYGLTSQQLPRDFPLAGKKKEPRYVFAFPRGEDALTFWAATVESALFSTDGAPLALRGAPGLAARARRVGELLLRLEMLGYLAFYEIPAAACLTSVSLFGADAEKAEASVCFVMTYPETFKSYKLEQRVMVEGWRWLYREVISERLPGSRRLPASDFASEAIASVINRLETPVGAG